MHRVVPVLDWVDGQRPWSLMLELKHFSLASRGFYIPVMRRWLLLAMLSQAHECTEIRLKISRRKTKNRERKEALDCGIKKL